MSYNKKLLSQIHTPLTKAKGGGKVKSNKFIMTPKQGQPCYECGGMYAQGGPIIDPRGQWAYPGQVTRIPGSNITMQGVPYPVYGVGSNGQEQMMQPGQEYNFGGAAYVDEYPMMQGGGSWNKFDIPKAQNGLTAKDKNNIIGYIQKLSKNKSSVENSQAVPVNNSRELSKEDMQRIASMSKLMVPTNTREVLDAERKEKYGSQWEAEKIEDKRKKEERKTAAITRSKVLAGDDAASFTFPDGTTKKWKDMDWREQSYISGKNLGSWNNDNWTDYINPLALLGSLSEGIGTAPYEAKKTDSIKPYLFGVGAPLLTGALGSLGAKNAGQFVENIVSPIPGNLSSIGRYLTEKTPLRSANKFNPFALTDNMLFNKEGVVNRQIFGDDAYNKFLEYGPTTRPNISQSDQMMDLVRAPKSDVISGSG